MATPLPPRHFSSHAGLPGDRRARLAARRAFVGLKLLYLDALEGLGGAEAAWLRGQVRSAEEPEDLWLLRAPLFAALAGPECRPLRQGLRRGLRTVFPETAPASAFTSF